MQEEQTRKMTINEQEQNRLRFEWRKMLENGYDQDLIDHENKASQEKKEILTGPTSITVLGTYYQ